MIKKTAILSFWILLALASVILFYFGAKAKGIKVCSGINIEVNNNSNRLFVDESGIKYLIRENGGRAGVPTNSVDLRTIESELKKNVWIKNAELYFDNNQMLHVQLTESVPIARIFMFNNNSFFIDSSAKYLPLNDNVVVRVPVFTGFTSDRKNLSPPDSALLQSVKQVADFIISDTFWMAFVAQINILPNTDFQIIPAIGNQIINIGNADDLPDKFNRIYSFYKDVLSKTGINKYKVIDVQYSGQVVASNESLDSAALQRKDTVQQNIPKIKTKIKSKIK